MPPDRPWHQIRSDLVGFVTRRVENRQAAEDIVQDVFERLQRAQPGTIHNPQAWLFRAARNATIDHYRTRRHTAEFDVDHTVADTPDEPYPNQATRELAQCLRPLAAQLPDKYRRAVTLVDLDGHTHQEAAQHEHLSISGTKSRVQRGRAQLGTLLTACCSVTLDTNGSITDYQPAPNCNCP